MKFSSNYYNFYAATAGSGTSSFTGEAPDSICPKGWRMVGSEGEKSWTDLFSKYYGGTHEDYSETGVNNDTHLLSSVLYFLRSGDYYWDYGIPGGRDWSGYYWTSGIYDTTNSFGFIFDDERLIYQNIMYKGYAESLR